MGGEELLAFLGLDVALDGFQRDSSNGAAIVGVRPQRRQFLLEVGKLLPQVVSRCPLDGLHQAVDAEFRTPNPSSQFAKC